MILAYERLEGVLGVFAMRSKPRGRWQGNSSDAPCKLRDAISFQGCMAGRTGTRPIPVEYPATDPPDLG
jgi:hypothetical protein